MADNTYPNSDILINHFNIRDQETLLDIEDAVYLIQTTKPIPTGNFDIAHLKSIHHHLFSPLYPWAGQFREVNMSKGGNRFANYEYITPSLNKLLHTIKIEDYSKNVDKKKFIENITDLFSDLNAIHPFREGNGRTQRLFLKQLGQIAGFDIDFNKVEHEPYTLASIESFHGDNTKLYKMFNDITASLTVKKENSTNKLDPLAEINNFKKLENDFKLASTEKERRAILEFREQQALKMYNNGYIMEVAKSIDPKLSSRINKISHLQQDRAKEKQKKPKEHGIDVCDG